MKKSILLCALLLIAGMFMMLTGAQANPLTGTLDSGSYTSDTDITTDETGGCIIPADHNVQFVSNGKIILKNGFHAQRGSKLNTYLNPTDLNDVDEDGMLDSWEFIHFTDIGIAALPGDDYDDDGFNNKQEHDMGTNPNKKTPTVTISADPELLVTGRTTTLRWSSINAVSATLVTKYGNGSVKSTESVDTNGSMVTDPQYSDMIYEISVLSESSESATDSLAVRFPEPEIELYADPDPFYLGNSTTLYWNINYASYAALHVKVGDRYELINEIDSMNGSIPVIIDKSTEYRIYAGNVENFDRKYLTINVLRPPKIISNPTTILSGETATLKWDATGADTCIVEPTPGGNVNPVGEFSVVPTSSTTYTITATYGAEEVSATTILNVAEVIPLNVPSDFATVQSAIDSASDGDWVLVADGTYTGTGNKNIDFLGKKITVRSENGPENCIIDCESDGRGFIFQNSEWSNSVVSGFTIINGYADKGGGICCQTSSPTIENCIITNNSASEDGGGIYYRAIDAMPDATYPEIRKCIVKYNIADENNDTSYGQGGGIYLDNYDTDYRITLSACDISNNISTSNGGGLKISGDVDVINCMINQNYASGAAGFYSTGTSSVINIINCTIFDNLTDNLSSWFGCVFNNESIYMTIRNSLIGIDYSYSIGENVHLWSSAGGIQFHYSDVFNTSIVDGDYGEGNISTVPYFISSYRDDDEDYHLYTSISSGTWAGNYAVDKAAYIDAPLTDIDGDFRPQGVGIDIGADEYVKIAEVDFTASSNSIQEGETITLAWQTTIVDSCKMRSITNDKWKTNYDSIDVNGTMEVSPDETTTYYLETYNAVSEEWYPVTVYVDEAPNIIFSADINSIFTGESVTLSWDVTDADSVSIDHGVGDDLNLNDSTVVSPTSTTTYTLTANKNGIPETASLTIIVTDPVPVISFSANPDKIHNGESSALEWNVTNADSVSIDKGVGDNLLLNDTATVSPISTTTYTLTATSPYGPETATATVYIAPEITFSADSVCSFAGENVTLSWDVANTDTVTLDPGNIIVDSTGIRTVTPSVKTTYTLTAVGPGGTEQSAITVVCDDESTIAEQVFLEAINRARQDPEAEALRLGMDLNEGLPPGTISSEPKQPLSFNSSLLLAARCHALDMINQDYYEHNSLDGRTPSDRAIEFGYPSRYVGENIALSDTIDPEAQTMLNLHDVLFIDAGVDGRGHRLSVLDDIYKEVGVGISKGYDSVYLNDDNYKMTCDFGTSFYDSKLTLLGVVYDDQNADSFYTAGEGIGNIEIKILETGETVTTGYAGGYDIHLLPGDYTIQASLPGGQAVRRQISIGNKNIKEDFIISEFAMLSPQVSLVAKPGYILDGDSATLVWNSVSADSCSIEPGGFTNLDPNGSIDVAPAGTTTYTITATGTGDSTSQAETTVTISTAVPTVSISADPTHIQSGDSVLLSWISESAASCSIEPNPGIGIGDRFGEILVTLTETTTYEITATGPYGTSVPATVTVYVVDEDTAILNGKVTDALDESSLDDATVTVTDADKLQTVETFSDGSYVVPGITLGQVEITISKAGYNSVVNVIGLSGIGLNTLDFALYSDTAVATVNGIFTNAATLQPEPGVTIEVDGTCISGVSGADGTFTLTDVPMGTQLFHITKDDFADYSLEYDINEDPFQMDLVYPTSMGIAFPDTINTDVTGYVYDAMAGKPIAGAIVKLAKSPTHTITTDQDGNFALSDLPEGSGIFTAMAENHVAIFKNLSIINGGADTFSFSLPPTTKGTLEGTITDAVSGEPIPFAEVSLGEHSMLGAMTEADGTYEMINVPEGTHTVYITHPAYESVTVDNVSMTDGSTVTLDMILTHSPVTGSLEGTITDKDSGAPVAGANLEVDGTGITTTTDSGGYYYLANLPAGLVKILITNASGYDDTFRTTPVMADENGITPTVTTADFKLDVFDPAPPDSISVEVTASEGGIIETPDGRFAAVIPPDALSGDAIITLMTPADGPTVVPGDELTLDPDLGLSDVKALGSPIQLVVEPADQGDPIPTIEGWILLTGRYFQSDADDFDLDESTAFPYYWDGTQWTVLHMNPGDLAVDRINNAPVAVVELSTTLTGDPVALLGSRERILLASLSDYLPDMDNSSLFKFILGAIINKEVSVEPNVKIYDKGDLEVVTEVLGTDYEPNPNALPFMFFHGWLPQNIIKNDCSGPNEGYEGGLFDENDADGYSLVLKDLVEATNGVYRPMFASYNGRATMDSIGNATAREYKKLNIKGDPAKPGDSSSGKFPYIDTLGFSKGGLVSRTFQANFNDVHNMVMVATPNHGTYSVIKNIEQVPGNIGFYSKILMRWSPGTKDLFPYDDAKSIDETVNPRMHALNTNPKSIPSGDMTLIAGTDGLAITGLDWPNDKIVPLTSVFCRPTQQPYSSKSLLQVKGNAKKLEYDFPFSHLTFGELNFRLKNNTDVRDKIINGFSDWIVAKRIDSYIPSYYSGSGYLADMECEVEVEYNVLDPQLDPSDNRQARDYDRIALVIYAIDESGNYHVGGDYVNAQGDLIRTEPIVGNSIDRGSNNPLELFSRASFLESDKIVSVECELSWIKPNQTTVSLVPKGNFKMPQ
ncbi:MAG: carboxypeptidase regulatory-like domain-containing protein [Desulfobacterales bacterium]|nr:carboxypeptidase regulatory-like domain-containing protein [Desulfobacterales bacterium]